MERLTDQEKAEVEKFLESKLLKNPDPLKDPQDPEELWQLQEREFSWLNFPEVEVE